MQNFEDIQNLVQDDIAKTDQVLIDHLSSDVALINQMSVYIIGAGGKRLRPLLLLLCARATNYQGDHHHLMAVVIELIHTATLVHDDVVDEAAVRRGEPSLNSIWDNHISVLMGDFLLSKALSLIVSMDVPDMMLKISKLTSNSVFRNFSKNPV